MPPGGVEPTVVGGALVFIGRFAFDMLPPDVDGAVVFGLVAGLLALGLLPDEQPVQQAATASKAVRAKVLRILFSPFPAAASGSDDERRARHHHSVGASGIEFTQVARRSEMKAGIKLESLA
ncbi:MAG: hypothetical protein QOF02_2621 [Blastocatellia bacterium]|nr:hypothetical protein [Blastocatellia bacterium]